LHRPAQSNPPISAACFAWHEASRFSRAGRYTGGYPVPGTWEAPLPPMPWRPGRGFTPQGGREIPLPCCSHMPASTEMPDWGQGRQLQDEATTSRPNRGADVTGDGCCSADTLPASLSNVSRSRPTTGPHVCFVTDTADADFWRPPAVGPGAFPDPPPRAWGPRRFSTEVPGPVLRAGPDVDTRPTPPRGTTKGTEVACGTSHRVEPHAEVIRHGG
jgi:hypothetical protein